VIRAYHLDRGDTVRDEILVPDSAHGTNPATAAMVGMKVVEVKSGPRGNCNIEDLKSKLSPRTAGMMLTNPNTIGMFEQNIQEISRLVHEAGGLMYGDGANFNAILGIVKPREVGFDFMHYNLHKTFTTPHGGGGPGSGAVGCTAELAKFLPGPRVEKVDGAGQPAYRFFEPEKSIGRVKVFWGNFGMLVRAWTYIRTLGAAGLREISETAVLNANYLRVKLQGTYPPAYNRICMHETVLKGQISEAPQARTLDIAKRLIDYGFHPPTVYFPLIVPEALMIEPTETESKRNMDAFVDAMLSIADEARRDIEMETKQGVKFYKTPDALLQEQLVAYDKVADKKSGENALFKEIVESQKAFAQRAVRWDMDNNVNRRMAYVHYFGKKTGGAAPKKA